MDDLHNDIQQAIEAYFAGEITADQLAELESWINADAQNARAFMDQLRFRELVGERVRERSNETGVVLAELAEFEASAHADVIELALHKTDRKQAHAADEDPGTLSAHDLASVGGYLLGKAALSKPAIYAYAAAVAILALVLINPWGGADDPITNPPTAQQDPQQQAKQVATLTATHNAAWAGAASAAPANGSPLYPNQRLTLTQGFAQITTNRGAIAIIQAPATFELINNNALRLHTGKLVGICETESSKGFVVRTRHMDITDLGTRFGVDVMPYRKTEVHVHQGEVIVSRPNPQGSPRATQQHVTANHAVSSGGKDSAITSIAADFDKFDDVLRVLQLRGTGFGLAEGERDPQWLVVADGKGQLNQPIPISVQYSESADTDTHWPAIGNESDKAQWLIYFPGYVVYGDPDPPGLDKTSYTFRGTVRVPDNADLQGAVLYLKYATDGGIRELRINGQAVEPIRKEANDGRLKGTFHTVEIPIEKSFLRKGMNNFDFDVKNPNRATGTSLYFYSEIRPSLD